MKPEFWDNLVRRLQAGESPEDLRAELSIGKHTMARYVAHARNRRVVVLPAKARA